MVGLGNPGRQYQKTRHNAGFLFLDRLVSEYGGVWVSESRFDGLLAVINIAGGKVMLLKPDTFMNRSGQSVGKVARYYKLLPEEILVIHDELDFDVGVVRLKKNGGHAGHNGVRDIIAHLGSREFYRLRVGIGRPPAGMGVADFVLSNPPKKEMDSMLSALDLVCSGVGQMVIGDISLVMNKLNAGLL
ncbi:MAG: aminoacyl-tRNA hydrolase [Gammaproteobacteria bacterium]